MGIMSLMFSKERAASAFRLFFTAPFLMMSLGYGAGRLLEIVWDKVEKARPDWIKWVEKFFSRTFIMRVTIIAAVFRMYSALFTTLNERWSKHLVPLPIDKEFFGPGKRVIFDDAKKSWLPHPKVTDALCHDRAMSLYGMTWDDFLSVEFTLGLEYIRNAMTRIFRHYVGIGQWANVTPDRKRMYQGIVNTSLGVYVRVPDFNFEMHNVMMAYRDGSKKLFTRVVVKVDHTKGEFVSMTLDWQDNVTNELVHNYEVTSLTECDIFLWTMVALYTHPGVHYWANGTAMLIADGSWALAKEATNITQWMNCQAVYGAWAFIGNLAATQADIVGSNPNEGIPWHADVFRNPNCPAVILEKSKLHRMNFAARERLVAHFKDVTVNGGKNYQKTDAVLAGTLLHSADHYYCSFYFTWASQSKDVLKSDLSFLRLALISENRYYLRRLRCVQHLDDPVCKILYESCKDIDPTFATYGLHIGCAF